MKKPTTHLLPRLALLLGSLLAPSFGSSLWAAPPGGGTQARESRGGIPQLELLNLGSGATVSVHTGQSLLVHAPQPLSRVSVADPEIATALIVSPQELLLHGKKPGTVSIILWDEQEQTYSLQLEVTLDTVALQNALSRIFPGEEVQVVQSGGSLVLTGHVSSQKVAEQILALAETEASSVVNMLAPGEKGEVLLQVRFAEVNRAAIQELGVNIFSTGAANTSGALSTQQFGSLLGNVGAVPESVGRGTDPKTPNLAAGGIGNPTHGSPSVFGLTDLLNIFLFRPDLNLGVVIRALEQRNLLQILAEPNLLAIDGQEASFLAGGEFPFPVVQGGTNFTAVTIQFKEFGVRLKFLPQIQRDGKIRLKVSPEVSSLDFSNALTVSGFLIPALSTRRASTEVELADGQSFAIAGLIDNRLSEVVSKVPLLGDIPFLGKLFRSRALNQTNTELMVMVTPRLVRRGQQPEPTLPAFPAPFLDSQEFDEKKGGSASPPRSPAPEGNLSSGEKSQEGGR